MLGYRPRYRSIEAVIESVSWLIEKGIVLPSASWLETRTALRFPV
jgi:hypothetical protein